VKIGDLEELEIQARENNAELIISNSHAAHTAERLDLPLLRAGFPQYDTLGGYQQVWIGYAGTRRVLFELANMLLSLERGEIHPYRSIYAQKPEYGHGVEDANESPRWQH
jgi:nitrogenase molybdenum-iron protein NifN